MANKVRVLIVDDSAIARTVFQRELEKDSAIEVVGTAPDAFVARDKILRLKPDVITLDVEMPRMDGLTFLRKLMASRPMPVIMVSALTAQGCSLSLQALELGAFDVIEKPEGGAGKGTDEFRIRLTDLVKASVNVRVQKRPAVQAAPAPRATLQAPRMRAGANNLIAIGASTGGTEALRHLLEVMPASSPGIVMVQHMPEKFTAAFAKRLNGYCEIEVLEAADGMEVRPGRAILARGDYHMVLQKRGMGFSVGVRSGPKVCRHRPSVDMLFDSVAKLVGGRTVGVILTGMGADGAAGMKKMRDAGARTIAQDEATCVVFGMPKEAIALEGVESIEPLPKIPQKILSMLGNMKGS